MAYSNYLYLNQQSLSQPNNLPSLKELGLDQFIPDYKLNYISNPSSDDHLSIVSNIIPSPKSTSQPSQPIDKPTKSLSKFSFISIFDKPQDPKPRRRYHQLVRPFNCIYSNCTKKYSTLNHLNAHIRTQNHGRPRFKEEFPKSISNSKSKNFT